MENKKKKVTINQVFDELIKLAKTDVHGDKMVACDMLTQDELFVVQEKLIEILESIDRKKCIKSFPWMYIEVKRKVL